MVQILPTLTLKTSVGCDNHWNDYAPQHQAMKVISVQPGGAMVSIADSGHEGDTPIHSVRGEPHNWVEKCGIRKPKSVVPVAH